VSFRLVAYLMKILAVASKLVLIVQLSPHLCMLRFFIRSLTWMLRVRNILG
jgi:hypothetical protein